MMKGKSGDLPKVLCVSAPSSISVLTGQVMLALGFSSFTHGPRPPPLLSVTTRRESPRNLVTYVKHGRYPGSICIEWYGIPLYTRHSRYARCAML